MHHTLWTTAEEHDAALKTVLQPLKDAGLTLNEQKCDMGQASWKFLGHLLTAKGLEPHTEHLPAGTQAPAPTDAGASVPSLACSPGMEHSCLTTPQWYNHLVPACVFEWTEEAQKCFLTVEELLHNSPALALFDPALPSAISISSD